MALETLIERVESRLAPRRDAERPAPYAPEPAYEDRAAAAAERPSVVSRTVG